MLGEQIQQLQLSLRVAGVVRPADPQFVVDDLGLPAQQVERFDGVGQNTLDLVRLEADMSVSARARQRNSSPRSTGPPGPAERGGGVSEAGEPVRPARIDRNRSAPALGEPTEASLSHR
ncbi:MAG: hypothetical protein M3460_25815 [Actinomycetota bacterium]|nr:hypothetical protein [Actinomycetota bacterium]